MTLHVHGIPPKQNSGTSRRLRHLYKVKRWHRLQVGDKAICGYVCTPEDFSIPPTEIRGPWTAPDQCVVCAALRDGTGL